MSTALDKLFPDMPGQGASQEQSNVAAFDRNHRNQPKQRRAADGRLLQDSNVWVNIGYRVTIGDEEMFVSLPFGIALDTMSYDKLPNNKSSNYYKLVEAKNKLLDKLMLLADKLAPGEEKTWVMQGTKLVVQMRRRNSNELMSEDEGTNPFDIDLGLEEEQEFEELLEA